MPRLKPPPSKPVAPDMEEERKPVEIDVGEQNVFDIEDDSEVLATDTDAEKLAKREASREYRQKKKEEDEARATENAELKKQLEDMRSAIEESRKQALDTERLRQEALAEAARRQSELSQHVSRADEAEYRAVLTAMSAAESEAESAQRDLENAQTGGDYKTAAEAQRKLSRAEAKLVQLEESKDYLERRQSDAARRSKEREDNPPAPRNMSIEQQIDSVSALMPSQKAWLKAHPDAWTDQRKNMRLQGAHVEAEDAGLTAGTKRYFDYLEERLGYKESTEIDTEDEPEAPVRTTRKLVSAPVSREARNSSGRPSSTKVTLSVKQQEAADIAGIPHEEYAKQFLKYETLKDQGYYNE